MTKCEKCAGELPHGAYGKVKCEYCGTINDVLTPEQEKERKAETEEAAGKTWIKWAVIITVLGIGGSIAAFVPIMSVQETYWTTETKWRTVEYQEKDPYTDTETTYTEETYQDEECGLVYPSIDLDWGDWGEDYYVETNIIFSNAENQAASVSTTMYWFDKDRFPYEDYKDADWDESDKERNCVDKKTKYITLKPLETKTVTFTSSLKRADYSTWGWYHYKKDKIEKCRTVTKTREVPETETVTKYRTIAKTRQEPYEAEVQKTQTVKKTLLEHLLA